ncbi:PAS domain-containing protein, partial [Bradyrhizobium sp. NBAIM20]|uniref:PAS domain-containing protein n=1 Tax=Bradyrhizobium sp. NBAIM20 TaxID=2793811 RepID=UPI001CD1B19A
AMLLAVAHTARAQFLVGDTAGRVIFFNAAFAQHRRVELSDWEGRPLAELFGDQDYAARAGLIAGLTRLMEAAIEAGRHDRAVTASQELLELTQQRSREQSQMFGEAVASLVRSARLETEKLAAERQAGWLEARVAERTAELSSAMGRLQA